MCGESGVGVAVREDEESAPLGANGFDGGVEEREVSEEERLSGVLAGREVDDPGVRRGGAVLRREPSGGFAEVDVGLEVGVGLLVVEELGARNETYVGLERVADGRFDDAGGVEEGASFDGVVARCFFVSAADGRHGLEVVEGGQEALGYGSFEQKGGPVVSVEEALLRRNGKRFASLSSFQKDVIERGAEGPARRERHGR